MTARAPEVPLAPGTVAIADLHLDAAEPEPAARFARWLAGLASVPRMLILGDLFDAWVGPVHARLPGARAVLAALAELSRRGTAIDLVPGNRDFLLGVDFERESGAVLRPAGVVGVAAGARVLFLHGDELCTRDLGYQRLRRVLRSSAVRWIAPRLPFAVASPIARRLRRASVRALEVKPSEEKAMQADAAHALAGASGADVLVCGHAHAARDERLPDGPRWIVLDAFGGVRDLLSVDERSRPRLGSSGAGDSLG